MSVAVGTGEARAEAAAGLTILPAERARLVRLCALLTGDREAAEDLAQETLYEAWRHASSLRAPERHRPQRLPTLAAQQRAGVGAARRSRRGA